MHPGELLGWEFVLCRDLHGECLVTFFTLRQTWSLLNFQIFWAVCEEVVTTLMPFMDSKQLKFEAGDIFCTLTVVADDANFGLFSQIVLIFVKKDL